jgi:hypothetical protein
MDDWVHVIWSDECYVYIGDDQGTVWVARSADEAWDDDCIVPTFKQSSIWIMVWACIMQGSKGPFVVLDYPGGRGGSMTADRYQTQILEAKVCDYFLQMAEERGQVIFQQDGAPLHQAKSTFAWLHQNKIETFPHPASSPGLSPIKPLWKTFKALIRAHPHIPTSLKELKIAAWEAWEQIMEQDIDNHVKKMEDRVKAVLAEKGGHTPY